LPSGKIFDKLANAIKLFYEKSEEKKHH
jgi:hypothetical protein